MNRIFIDTDPEKSKIILGDILNLDKSIFIYPTDTVYGIGANALNSESTNSISKLKKRDNNKSGYSIIPPSLQWIQQNFILNEKVLNLISKSPGKQTFILSKKEDNFLNHLSINNSIAIRISKDYFSNLLIEQIKVPIISTSVNLSGEKQINEYSEIETSELDLSLIDYFFDIGALKSEPSSIYDCTNIDKIIRVR